MRCAHATYGTCTLTHASYGVSTLTDVHSREPTIGDGLMRLRRLETVCVRSPHVQTECIHDATARDGVCTKRQPTHLHVLMRYYKCRAHMISSIGFVHAGPCACPHACFKLACPIFYFNLNLFILDRPISFLLLPYFSLCNTCTL